MNWNDRCREAIRRERQEVETRHGIRIGQTEIYCSRCGRSWGYGKHTCQDIRFEALKEAKKGRYPIPDRVYGLNSFYAL